MESGFISHILFCDGIQYILVVMCVRRRANRKQSLTDIVDIIVGCILKLL